MRTIITHNSLFSRPV